MVVEPRIFVLQSYLFSISMHVILICALSSNAFALVTITQSPVTMRQSLLTFTKSLFTLRTLYAHNICAPS